MKMYDKKSLQYSTFDDQELSQTCFVLFYYIFNNLFAIVKPKYQNTHQEQC